MPEFPIDSPVSLTGLGCLSALGHDTAGHLAAIDRGETRFAPLANVLGTDSPHASCLGAWIEPRSLLCHRKWSPLAMAARHVAREAVADAGWSAADLRDAALFVGTSRGAIAGWLAPWPGRRPLRLMAASNSLHSEAAAAVSMEFGIEGPWQVLANGCTAGLDALALAHAWLSAGLAPRALVVAADLPLVPALLDAYAATGILANQARNDPYHPSTNGILPAEGAAALALETGARANRCRLAGCAGNADTNDPVGIAADGGRLVSLLESALRRFGNPVAVCPHASGTAVQAVAETQAVSRAFRSAPALLPLKPFTGHTIGASGLLELAILASFLQQHRLPPVLPGLHCPAALGFPAAGTSGMVFKVAAAMGGRNSLAAIAPPP